MTNPQPNASDIANAERALHETLSEFEDLKRAAMYARLEAEKRVAEALKQYTDWLTNIDSDAPEDCLGRIVSVLRSQQPK